MKKTITSFLRCFKWECFACSRTFWNTKVKENNNNNKKRALLFDLHRLAVRCLLSKAELLSPLSLSLSLCLSLSLSLSLSCGAVDLGYIPFNAISQIPHAVT